MFCVSHLKKDITSSHGGIGRSQSQCMQVHVKIGPAYTHVPMLAQ